MHDNIVNRKNRGAAAYLAERITRVVDVWKLEEFGMTEAIWLLEVENFPAIVTMEMRMERACIRR